MIFDANTEIRLTYPNELLKEILDSGTNAVSITLTDGTVLDSGPTEASGGPDPQPTEAEVVGKYRAFAGTVLGQARVEEIETAVMGLDGPNADFKAVLDSLAGAVA